MDIEVHLFVPKVSENTRARTPITRLPTHIHATCHAIIIQTYIYEYI